jgi:hypothetical protein
MNKKTLQEDVYNFISKNLDKVKELVGIEEVSEFDGEDELATIDDDANYVTYTFSFDIDALEEMEETIEHIRINNKTIYYVVGEG